MRKNQRGFGIVVYVLLTLIVITSIVGWRLYQQQKNVASENSKPESSTAKTNSNKLTMNPQQNASAKDYPKPTAPTALRATPAGSGYNLTWVASVSTGAIANYQVFYQGNLIAEPTTTSYQHTLPPPTPSCNPILLTYYVKAVDNSGSLSDPSTSVTVQFGGC